MKKWLISGGLLGYMMAAFSLQAQPFCFDQMMECREECYDKNPNKEECNNQCDNVYKECMEHHEYTQETHKQE